MKIRCRTQTERASNVPSYERMKYPSLLRKLGFRILYQSEQPGLSLSSGGPPAGVICHWGVPSLESMLLTSRGRPGSRQCEILASAAARVRVSSPSSLRWNLFFHRPTPRRVGRIGTVSSIDRHMIDDLRPEVGAEPSLEKTEKPSGACLDFLRLVGYPLTSSPGTPCMKIAQVLGPGGSGIGCCWILTLAGKL